MPTRTPLRAIVVLAVVAVVASLMTFGRSVSHASPNIFRVSTQETQSSNDSIVSGILSRLPLMPGLTSRRRLIAFMVENHADARAHQVGLASALLVAEIPVEGFISRFVAIFDINALPRTVGPVRSLRPYFLDGILPWAETVFYAGGSPEALERTKSGEVYGVNGLAYDDPAVFGREEGFYRESGAPAPHNLFVDREAVTHFLADVPDSYLEPVPWPPYSLTGEPHQSVATKVRANFYNPEHNVRYDYDRWSGTYARTNGETLGTARPRNVLMLETAIEDVGPFGRLRVDMIGNGRMLLFRGGNVFPGRWSRGSIQTPFVFTGDDGEELRFASGQIWMMVLPTLERVTWDGEIPG